jgi:hypothetical protein
MVIADKVEAERILGKGKIADIAAFIKNAARANPELVKDPEAFDREWDYHPTPQQMSDELAERLPESIGTKRAEFHEVLEKYDADMAKSYSELTDRQKAFGQIASKLSFVNGIDEADKIFAWADIQFGDVTIREKCLAMFQAAQLIGTLPMNYRGVRKMFVAMVAGNSIDVQTEWLEAKDKYEATQKAIAAKLLKADSIHSVESIFDWAEVELARQLPVMDRYFVFFQVAEVIPFTEDHVKALRKILIRMNKD